MAGQCVDGVTGGLLTLLLLCISDCEIGVSHHLGDGLTVWISFTYFVTSEFRTAAFGCCPA